MFQKVSPNVDFADLERKRLAFWSKKEVLKKYLSKNSNSSKNYSFLDGPITANNPMAVHHAWGRTYKDLWQRFFNMRGYAQRFQNGFDEQGLWVEVEVEKDLGLKTKKDIESLVPGNIFESIAKFVNLCKERVKKFSAVQTEQSKRLGYFMDWENSYHTSSDQNNYAIWSYLKKIKENGWLYKGKDTVPWCPRCGTAISQHEILTEEYKEITHKAVYLKYPIVGKEKEYLIVWTTTPWTLPGNSAVAVNPDLEYQATEINGELVWYAKDTWDRLQKILLSAGQSGKVEKSKLLHRSGKDMIGWAYEGPFDQLGRVKKEKANGNFHRVVGSEELVTAEEGTGLVHIAPGAGEEDFKLGKEQDIPVIELIGEDATYINDLGEFSGKNAKDHPELILDYLQKHESGKFFVVIENYKHRYPTCWRCKTELVWRVVDEWYIAMDRKDPEKGKTYREMMKEVIRDIKWIPSWGYDRELDWLNNMHDWLISKKRYWGLALPIWECKKCGNFDVIGSREELKKEAVRGWKDFDGNSPHRPWVDKVKIKCSKCGELISRIADVGNPWLDAGIVPFSTVGYFENRSYWQKWFPADFITESFPGQFKNWFYSLIAMSAALENRAPFKVLLGHGQVRDEKGEEMHKSKGNAIWFDEAAEKMGVDVMRWVYLKTNPENNVNFGYHVATDIRRAFHLRLWNVYAFLVNYARVDKWQPIKDEIRPEHILDRWIFSKLNSSINKITNHLDAPAYESDKAVEEAEKFVINDLSNWYVRRIRGRVGPTVPNSKDKKQAYQTLWTVLVVYSKVLAPMIPFITDEIYTNLTGELSVHLTNWPGCREDLINKDIEKQMDVARKIVEAVFAIRKEKNIKVRQPLQVLTCKLDTQLDPRIEEVILGEVNVKNLEYNKSQKELVKLDIRITPNLKAEGEAREVIRQIQESRKKAAVSFDDRVVAYLPSWPEKFEDLIKKETLSQRLIKHDEIKVEKV